MVRRTLKSRRGRRGKTASTRRRGVVLSPLAMAHLLESGDAQDVISGDMPPGILSTLLAAYIDRNSFVLFEDLPLCLRTRSGCKGATAAEQDFRQMLFAAGVLDGEEPLEVKQETEEGSRRRERIGIARDRRRSLQSISGGNQHTLPHNFYQKYY